MCSSQTLAANKNDIINTIVIFIFKNPSTAPTIQMTIIVSKNEAVGKIETWKLWLFDSANEYSPSLPICYSQVALFDFAVLLSIFAVFTIFAVLHAVFAVEKSWRSLKK